ncbi:MAG: glutathione S-transferase, partial [Vibrio casei]
PKLRQWLDRYLQSKMFSKVMSKHELWLVNRIDVLMESKSS